MDANHTHDAGGARTIEPIPVEYQFNYFEVKILSLVVQMVIYPSDMLIKIKLNQNIGMTKGKYFISNIHNMCHQHIFIYTLQLSSLYEY